MDHLRVYRPRRDQGWLLLALAAPLLAIVGLVPDAVGGYSGLAGGAIAPIGITHLRTRVEVGPDGVAKRPRGLGRFAARWSEVESWSVVDLRGEDTADTFSHRAVRFIVGRRRLEVREAEVHRPGFEAFLADVRVWAGDHERTECATVPKSPTGADLDR